MSKIAVCLGTNDIGRNKDDSDQVNVHVSRAVSKLKSHFPHTPIGICNIFPRRGGSNHIHTLNETAQHVNKFMYKLCQREDSFQYIDLYTAFFQQGTVIKSFFDKNDSSGVHLGTDGVQCVTQKLKDFFHVEKPNPQAVHTPSDRKRIRSDNTSTPPSADRKSKLAKPDSEKIAE